MNAVVIRPGPVSGSVHASPSKSYTHRALVIGHLSRREFRVEHPLDSEDTRATAAALGRLGSPVVRGKTAWTVRPQRYRPSSMALRLDCRESGTTLRFVSALAALSDRTVLISGSRRLSVRPVDELLSALSSLGAHCRHTSGSGFPIEIRGPIHGGRVSVDVSRSSQFASALLLTLPTLHNDSTIELRGEVVSEPYLDATLAALSRHGVRIARRGRRLRVPGPQRLLGSSFAVPGDASSASYLWAAAAVGGGTARVLGISTSWPQADLAVLDLLESTGASVSRGPNGATVSEGPRRPFQFDLTNAPDLYPLAGVLAATSTGESRITGAEHVVFKESDRRHQTVRLARALGARVHQGGGGLVIEGTARPRALRLADLTDHRLVMSAAVAALATDGPSVIGDAAAVRKSFPGFWLALKELSVEVKRR